MFENFEELKELIRQGKTNEEIIEGRLKWLQSQEYESAKMPSITQDNCVYFYNGFMNDEVVSFDPSDRLFNISYMVDGSQLKDVYFQILDVIRNNMDRGFPIDGLFDAIKKYFEIDKNSPYYELDQFYKKLYPKNPYKLRETLGYIMSLYSHSSFKGSIAEFGKLYAFTSLYQNTRDEIYREAYDAFFNVVDNDFYDYTREDTIPLIQTKGSGIAACTECSILSQNCLSFFGFNTYMLGGHLNSNGKVEPHNFNLVIKEDGNAFIVDSSQLTMIPVGAIEDVTKINGRRFKCRDGVIRQYKLHPLVLAKNSNSK